MLDIENASVQRIGNTNLVRFVIDVRSDIDREALGPAGTIGVNINLSSESFLAATISGAGVANDAFSSKHFAVTGSTLMMRVEEDTITLTFPQEYALGDGESSPELTVSVGNQFGGDSATIAGTIGPAPQPSRTDFATATSIASFSGPISDAFLVPSTNVFAVWQRAQERFDLDPATVDGFVVYETFPTLGVPAASVGNAGVDHIAIGDAISSAKPREPNLIEMHQIRYLWNNSDDNAMQVLLHEWGHRWMFFIEHDENGVPTHALNAGGHPAIYVDTRAAFAVNNPYDCSVMGGATFTDHGDGTFTGPPDTCGAGYSWLDLYLMGLASPGEVPDFFYLTNLDPPIEEVGYVEAQTFHGTRRNVSIGDVTSRMGQRSPAFPDTQRTFKVLFALVYDPAEPIAVEDVDLVAHFAELFRARFAAATGNRASVDTSFGESRRARPVRR